MKNNQSTRELLQQALNEAKQQNLTQSTDQQQISDDTEKSSADFVSSGNKRLFSKEFADRLSELPSDWQEYLTDLEATYLKNKAARREELDHWLEHLFGLRDTGVCCRADESPREWVEKMAYVEHMLCANPGRTLETLARLYLKPVPFCSELAPLTLYYKKRCEDNAKAWLCKCLSEKNKEGRACFPHKEEVISLILTLLSTRLAPDIRKAYDMAVWMDENTRAQMIDETLNERIRQKADEARLAREKSFLTQGTFGISGQNKTQKSTRELLEEAFRKYHTEA